MGESARVGPGTSAFEVSAHECGMEELMEEVTIAFKAAFKLSTTLSVTFAVGTFAERYLAV